MQSQEPTPNQECFFRQLCENVDALTYETCTTVPDAESYAEGDIRSNKRVCFAPRCGIGIRDVITYAVAGGDFSEIEAIKNTSDPSCLLREDEGDDWADTAGQTF